MRPRGGGKKAGRGRERPARRSRREQLTGHLLLVGPGERNADVRYGCGLASEDPIVLLARGRRRWVVVPDMEKGRAQREVHRGVAVLTPKELGLKGGRARKRSAWVLGLLRRLGVRRVIVPPDFPVGLALRLRGRVDVRVRWTRAFPERSVKTVDELRRMRQVQRAAAYAMRAAVRMIARARVDARGYLVADGKRLTSEKVRRRIACALAERDCVCEGAIVAGGRWGADPHERGKGALRAGEPIVIDIFPRHVGHGYWGDLTRTVVKGKPPDEVRRMFEAVRAAHAAALERVRAGVTGARIHEVARNVLQQHGFETRWVGGRGEGFIHGTGHGVGLSIHEDPVLGPGGGRLRVGHVVTVEPGLYYRRVGGVRIEDTVVVERDGCKPLAKCEIRLEV